jgi:RHS repeat-associated protein
MTEQQLSHAVALIVVSGLTAGASAQNRPVTQYLYDANGNLTRSVDALNRPTHQAYDTLNRLRRITQPAPATGQPTPIIQFDLDGSDQLTRVVDPRNLATSYAVSGLGNVATQTSPDTGVTSRTFDATGNVKTSKDARGRTTTYTYDGLNRLIQAKYADGTSTYFYYDEGTNALGRLTRIFDPGSITTAWTYDIQGRVLTRTQTVGSGTSARTHQLTYTYNNTTGQLASITYPSGRLITFGYHSTTKDVQTVNLDGVPVASAITLHPTGLLKKMTLGNGVQWASTLDQDGRTTSYTLNGAVYTVNWDAANRITAINHATDAVWNRSFGYDNLDRITSFASPSRSQAFAYDLTGNLTAKSELISGTQTDYTYAISESSNRMTGISSLGIGYSFDAAGNRTGDGRITYTYNARGRMSRAVVINGATSQTFNYLVNGLEQRVRKTGPSSVVPQGTQIFVYDDGGRLLGEYDNLGRARIEHIWLDDRPIAAVRYTYVSSNLTPATTTVSYVEADHLGTPRMITDSARRMRWLWHSAPYGDTMPNDNPSALGAYTYNLRFPGQYFDKETSLYYNWHRDYEATTGRYVQSDPIGLEDSVNTYAYVNLNPLTRVDPFGLYGVEVPSGDPGSGIFNPYVPDPELNFARNVAPNGTNYICWHKCMQGSMLMCSTLSAGSAGLGATAGGVMTAYTGGAASTAVPWGARIGWVAGQGLCRAALDCKKKCREDQCGPD